MRQACRTVAAGTEPPYLQRGLPGDRPQHRSGPARSDRRGPPAGARAPGRPGGSADKLAGQHSYHATRADLLRRLGRSQESRAAYGNVIELAGNTAETAYLTRRRDQLG